MSTTAGPAVRDDGLTRTTLRIARDLTPSLIADVVQTLQRVPGVLTVHADAENARALIAHDPGVPAASLVAAAARAGAAPNETAAVSHERRASVFRAPLALAALLAILLIDMAFASSPGKRWFLLVPLIIVLGFGLHRTMRARAH